MHHELVDEVGVSLSMIHELEDRLRVLIDTRQQFIIELATSTLQLCARKVTQIVVGLSNKFFRIEESVHQKTAAANLPRQPAMEARVKLALWHLGALHAAEPRPVVDPEVRNPRQQHLDDTTAQIVRNEEVRVDQM